MNILRNVSDAELANKLNHEMKQVYDMFDAVKVERDQLKAQVNCLRKAALDAISYMTGGEAKANLRDAYDATPEQCLAEVKAKAIEDVTDVMRQEASYTYDDDYYIEYLLTKVDKIRERAK